MHASSCCCITCFCHRFAWRIFDFWINIHIFWRVYNHWRYFILISKFSFARSISKCNPFFSRKPYISNMLLPVWSLLFATQIIISYTRSISMLLVIRSFFFRYFINLWFTFDKLNFRIILARTRIFRIHLKKLIFSNRFCWWEFRSWVENS